MNVLIPESSIYQTEFSNLTKTEKLTCDNIVIENGVISNLGDPINAQDISDINYARNTLDFTQNNEQITINNTFDTTYSAYDLTRTIINRNPNGDTRFDSFDTVSNVITELNFYGTVGTSFIITIVNVSTDYSIILNYSDFNIIGINNNIVVYPGATAFFYCIITGTSASTGTGTGINAYYSNTINKGIANNFKKNNLGMSFSVLRSYQLLTNNINVYNYELFSNDVPAIPNCIFNILGDYNVQVTGSFNITGSLPSSDQIIESLGLTDATLEEGTTFKFVVKLTAFLSHLPLLYTYQLTSDGSIDLDPNSLFLLEFSELAWKYAEYAIIANPIGSTNKWTIYCISFYNIFTQNI